MRSNSAQLSFTIRPLENSDLAAAAVICAEAMLDNPIHIRVFGQASLARNRRLKRFFPGLLAYVYRKGALSLLGSIRLAIWLSTWARIDPIVPHWHLGPLAVDPTWQKQGIGTQLMVLACDSVRIIAIRKTNTSF